MLEAAGQRLDYFVPFRAADRPVWTRAGKGQPEGKPGGVGADLALCVASQPRGEGGERAWVSLPSAPGPVPRA